MKYLFPEEPQLFTEYVTPSNIGQIKLDFEMNLLNIDLFHQNAKPRRFNQIREILYNSTHICPC